MSTILDALRRLESDRRRKADDAPLEARVIATDGASPRGRRPRRPWLVGGVVALLAVGGAALFGLSMQPDGRERVAPEAGPSDALAAAASVAAKKPAGAGQPSVERLPEVAAGAGPAGSMATDPRKPASAGAAVGVAGALASSSPSSDAPAPIPIPVVTRGAVTRSAADARVAKAPAASAPADTLQDVRPISALPVARPDAANTGAAPRAGARAESTVETAAVAPRQRPAPTPSATKSAPPAPAVEPVAVSPRVREVAVVKTVWHPSPDRRIASLKISGESSGREVREGDVVEGLSVREIKLSGVVFEREGVTVERRVGAGH